MKRFALTFALALAAALPLHAEEVGQTVPAATGLPAWEDLSAAQREALIAPLRARWDDNPGQRAEMLRRAQEWNAMDPEARKRAVRGMHRWEKLSPAQRAEAKALYMRMKGMSPDARRALRDRWHTMTPEQRAAWLKANPPR